MLPRNHQGIKSKGATGHDVSSRSPPDKSHGTPTGYAPSGLQLWVPSHTIGHVPPNCTTTWTYPVQGRHSPTAHMPCGGATHQPDMCRPGVPLTNTRVTIFFYRYYLNAFTVAATFFCAGAQTRVHACDQQHTHLSSSPSTPPAWGGLHQ